MAKFEDREIRRERPSKGRPGDQEAGEPVGAAELV